MRTKKTVRFTKSKAKNLSENPYGAHLFQSAQHLSICIFLLQLLTKKSTNEAQFNVRKLSWWGKLRDCLGIKSNPY